MNDRFILRFGSLLILAFIIFSIIWPLSYYFLPEGLMRGKTPTEYIVGPELPSTFIKEWFKIAGFNLMATFLVIILNLVMWIDLIPLGYIYPFGQIILYAVFIGTNSFFIPMPERMAPSLAILARAGPYEMIGFLLVAAATYNQSRYALRAQAGATHEEIRAMKTAKLEEWGIDAPLWSGPHYGEQTGSYGRQARGGQRNGGRGLGLRGQGYNGQCPSARTSQFMPLTIRGLPLQSVRRSQRARKKVSFHNPHVNRVLVPK